MLELGFDVECADPHAGLLFAPAWVGRHLLHTVAVAQNQPLHKLHRFQLSDDHLFLPARIGNVRLSVFRIGEDCNCIASFTFKNSRLKLFGAFVGEQIGCHGFYLILCAGVVSCRDHPNESGRR